MKIIVAPDKFKGSLTSKVFCDLVGHIFEKKLPKTNILKLPLADGGDGTIEVVQYYLGGQIHQVEVNNPFFKPINASYLYSEATRTAFIEMAEASGLKVLTPSSYSCKDATTFGTGELIKDAISKGAKDIILGIGGSATNDCGIGMATALGYRFLDIHGREVIPIGLNLKKIVTIEDIGVLPILSDVRFRIACDVCNPLYGKNGAAYVYAAQKGATPQEVSMLEEGLRHFSKVMDRHFHTECHQIDYAGAAGGMGVAGILFLKASAISGFSLIKEVSHFENHVSDADWVITGEGSLDSQTFSGKTIGGIMDSVDKNTTKVAVFCGTSTLDATSLKAKEISYVDTIISRASSLQDAIFHAEAYLRDITNRFIEKELQSIA